MIRRITLVSAIAALLLTSAGAAVAGDDAPASPTHFATVYAAIADTGNYNPKISLRKIDGGVRITPVVVAGTPAGVVNDNVSSAFVHAILRAFVATDLRQVHVIAYPVEQHGKIGAWTYKKLDAPYYEVTIGRHAAANVLFRLLGTSSFDALVHTAYGIPNMWTDSVDALFYGDAPGPEAAAGLFIKFGG